MSGINPNRGPAPTINAQAVWRSNPQECAKLYRQFLGYFAGSFRTIQTHYGWTRSSMLWALRYGRSSLTQSELAEASSYWAGRRGSQHRVEGLSVFSHAPASPMPSHPNTGEQP